MNSATPWAVEYVDGEGADEQSLHSSLPTACFFGPCPQAAGLFVYKSMKLEEMGDLGNDITLLEPLVRAHFSGVARFMCLRVSSMCRLWISREHCAAC